MLCRSAEDNAVKILLMRGRGFLEVPLCYNREQYAEVVAKTSKQGEDVPDRMKIFDLFDNVKNHSERSIEFSVMPITAAPHTTPNNIQPSVPPRIERVIGV